MKKLYANVTQLPGSAAATVYAAYRWAVTHDDMAIAAAAVHHPNAPQALLQAAADNRDPRIRSAWLTRRDHSLETVRAAIRRERRGDVLAAAVGHAQDNPQLLAELAALHKQPVAWELLACNLDDTAARHVLGTLAPHWGSATEQLQERLYRFACAHPKLVTDLLDTIGAPRLQQAALLDPDLTVEQLTTVVTATVTGRAAPTRRAWQDEDHQREAAELALAHPQLTEELLVTIARDYGARSFFNLRVPLARARLRLESTDYVATRLAQAKTEPDPDALCEIWDDKALDGHRTELLEALCENPETTPTMFMVDLLPALQDHLDVELANTIARVHGEATLIDIVAMFDRFRLDLLGSGTRPATPVLMASAWLETNPGGAEQVLAAGVLDQHTIGSVPWSALEDNSHPLIVSWTQQRLADRLGDDLLAWEALATYAKGATCTLDQLIVLALASTGAGSG